MKTKLFSLIAPLMVAGSMAFAQDNYDNAEVQPDTATEEEAEDEGNKLSISGSADLYYRYAGEVNNDPTSFAGSNNTIALGMANVIFSQSLGKASFVADLSFGPRSDGSIGSGNYIQNLYASYQFTEKLSATAGFMGTFVGYEVISPAANFNYTTSYLFSNGPFQNAGAKLDYAFSDKVSLMVGLFTDGWDVTAETSSNGMSGIGAQLAVSPVDGLDLYVNGFHSNTRTVVDLTAGYQMSDKFYLGLNAAWADKKDQFTDADAGIIADQVYTGVATYLQYAFSESFSLGGRYEYFKNNIKAFDSEAKENSTDNFQAINAFTLSGNIALGPLMVIPEYRMDMADVDIFDGKDGDTDSFSQALIAVVYAF